MKVFVIGYSDSGKTTTAQRLSDALQVPVVHASDWVVERVGGKDVLPSSKDMRAHMLSVQSTALLRVDPMRAVRHMATHNDLRHPCIVEGLRNLHDFVHLYDPRYDLVIVLHRAGCGAMSVFEEGVVLIEQYLAHLRTADLLSHENRHSVFVVEHTDFGAVYEEALNRVVRRTRTRLRHVPPQIEAQCVHVNMSPFSAGVRKEYFYDMEKRYVGTVEQCTVFAVAGYPHETPTFSVRTLAGAMFSYVPASALVAPGHEVSDDMLSLRELVYHNCPEGPITAVVHGALSGPVQVYFKDSNRWMSGEYLLTLDWYEGNDLLHLVVLENGQYAFQPSHKVLFGTCRALPDYKKMSSTWKV